jgi:hypothetical protein
MIDSAEEALSFELLKFSSWRTMMHERRKRRLDNKKAEQES